MRHNEKAPRTATRSASQNIQLAPSIITRRRPVSLDPSSKSYQRLARRFAVNALRGTVKAVCLLGDIKDIREASFAVGAVLVRVNAKDGGK